MDLQIVKRIYRSILPETFRKSRLAAKLKSRFVPHNAIYDRHYYLIDVDGAAVSSSGPISAMITRDLSPQTVIDLGCGTGALLLALRQRGCKVFGLEYSNSGIEICRSRELPVRQFDIERDSVEEELVGHFDLVVSMEVAEHIPGSIADLYVETLTKLSATVLMTAATIGQGGVDHVNEQPHSYWIEKLEGKGFRYLDQLSEAWRKELGGDPSVAYWYSRNIMIFKKERDLESLSS